jgi:hypothetical protein
MNLRTAFLTACLGCAWSFGAAAQTVTIGETAVLSAPDSGNGNLLLAQEASLSQSATIQSMSFYATAAAGNLVLGVYDATGPSGGPGNLVAQTAEFEPVVGWNVAATTTTPTLSAGNYWLAYLPSSSALSFVKENNTGPCYYYSLTFTSTLPKIFSTQPANCTPTTWSLYATLGTTATPTLSLTDSPSSPSVPANATVGTVVTTLAASWSNGSPFTGTLSFVPPSANDGGLFTLSGSSGNTVVVNGSLASLGNTTQRITVQATQGSSVSLNIPIAVTAVVAPSAPSAGGGTGAAGILPSANNASANWQMAGMLSVGGIPNRTTVCATVSPNGGGADDTANIQNAINSCPAGEVVSLAAGTFTIGEGNFVLINKGVTLRGSGPGTTVLTRTGGAVLGSYNPGSNPSPMVILGPEEYNNNTTSTNLTADGAQGAYSVDVASTSGFSVGQIVLLDELSGAGWQTDVEGLGQIWAASDYRVVYQRHNPAQSFDDPYPDFLTWFSRSDRVTSEYHKITAISGNTITFDSPLTISYRASQTAQLSYTAAPFTENASVENLTSQYADNGAIWFSWCANCWASQVEVTLYLGQGGNGGFYIQNSFRVQLEEVYVHKAVWPVPGGDGYNIALCCGSSEVLVENSISVLANKVMVSEASGAGSVVAYNYMDMGMISGDGSWQEDGINNSHFVGSHHMLLEGNWTFNMDSDTTHGNAIYNTFFRNNSTAFRSEFEDYLNGNAVVNDVAQQSTNGPLRTVGMHDYSYWDAIVGNVLGVSGQMSGFIYSNTMNNNNWPPAIYMLGWCETANYIADPMVMSSALVDGNYDYHTNSVTWAASDTSHTLPNSLYLSSEPAFFTAGSGYVWPPYNPLGSPQINTLPAKARYDAGTPFAQP